jgi:hypothetical protein
MSEPTAAHSPEATGGSPPMEAGEQIEGRYELTEPSGGGVTATLWRARDTVLARPVEVKIWRDSSPESVASQEEELASLRQEDPGLAKLLDAGTHRGRPFIVSDPGQPEAPAAHPPVPAAQPTVEVPPPPKPEAERFETTPPSGVPATPRRTGDRVVGVTVAVVLVAVVLVAAGLLARPGADGDQAGDDAALGPIAFVASTFDPEGDGEENPRELPALADNNPATSWSTDRYSNRAFGNLKPGLGLVIQPQGGREITSVEVRTESGGWSAQLHRADSPAADLAGWGDPIATLTSAGTSGILELAGPTVGPVLVWFTDLGDASRLSVTEIVLSAE